MNHETPEEHTVFTVLFKSCLKPNSTDLDMLRFRNLFQASQLKKEDLKTLYMESIKINQDSQMDRMAFGVFCKFLTLKLNNLPVTVNHLQTNLQIPSFLLEEYKKLTQFTQQEPEPKQKEINHNNNPRWDTKYQISETNAREYVDFICTRLSISMIDELDTVVLLSKQAKDFFSCFEVDNKLKGDLWRYLDRGNEQKLRFFFVVMALHFLKLKIEYNVWVLGLFKKQDFDDRFKEYFNQYMTRSHKCRDIDEFFLSNFNVPFRKQAYSTGNNVQSLKQGTPQKSLDVLRKDSEIDEPRCIPKKEVTCQAYHELYQGDGIVDSDHDLLDKLKDGDTDKMFENILGYFGNNISIHQNRQRDFKEELEELESEKGQLLEKLEDLKEEYKKKIQKQTGYISELKQMGNILESLVDPEQEEVDEVVLVKEEDMEFPDNSEILQDVERGVNQHKAEMQDLVMKLHDSGYSGLLNYVNKKLKSYNRNILKTLGKSNTISKQENTQSSHQSEEENHYQPFEDEEDEGMDFFHEMDDQYNKQKGTLVQTEMNKKFHKKAEDLFGGSDDE